MNILHRRFVILSLVVAIASIARGATPDQVQAAIDKGCKYLYSQQKDGNWELDSQIDFTRPPADERGGQWGGRTAVATYALLAAGESPQKLAAPIKFLENAQNIVGIYALGLRCQIWNLIPPDAARNAALQRDAATLQRCQRQDNGMYDYTSVQSNGWDHSVSQYGVLGAWACAQQDANIPAAYWKLVDTGWRATQQFDGSWSYDRPGGKWISTVSMTAAGIATLYITREQMTTNAAAGCRGNPRDVNIDSAINWLGAHFNDAYTGESYYTLYGIERVGVASGMKYLASHNWFEEGADFLVKGQQPDGSWNASNISDSCFAILFLSRGRAPVLMNKLKYNTIKDGKSIEANWNQRPLDLLQLTKWCAAQLEIDKFSNWQVIDLTKPAEQMHDAPILYVSGDQPLDFPEPDEQKLKEYIDQGGMIVFNADCASLPFSDSVKQLASKLFSKYTFRRLPDDHVIFTNEQFPRSHWKSPPPLLGLTNGVRELMILIPDGDLSRAWQGNLAKTQPMKFQLGADLLLYAADKKNIRAKDVTYIVTRDETITATKTLKIARIQFDGNWNPEPGGWPRLANIMHNQDKIDLTLQDVDLTHPNALNGFDIASLTGTGKFNLDAAASKQLKAFVDRGGTLIVDAAGGSSTFAADATEHLQEIFGAPLAMLNADHPLYAIDPKLETTGYRDFTRKNISDPLTSPRIRGITIANRTAIFYSPEDLSAGLVGQPVDGIIGYDPPTATALMQKIILYSQSK